MRDVQPLEILAGERIAFDHGVGLHVGGAEPAMHQRGLAEPHSGQDGCEAPALPVGPLDDDADFAAHQEVQFARDLALPQNHRPSREMLARDELLEDRYIAGCQPGA